MYYLLASLMFLNSTILFAEVYEKFIVSDIHSSQREGFYYLNTNLAHTKVNIDCASFVHGLYLNNEFFYLYEHECLKLLDNFFKIKKEKSKICVTLYQQNHPRYALSKKTKNCD